MLQTVCDASSVTFTEPQYNVNIAFLKELVFQ